jgi:hypothetical protein
LRGCEITYSLSRCKNNFDFPHFVYRDFVAIVA